MATDRARVARRAPLALIGTALLAILAGCGSSSTTTVIQTVPASSSTATTSTATSTTPSNSITGSTPTVHLSAFSSPTGNIGCVISPASVRCDIGDRTWKPPPAPADCPLDYGQGVEVGRKNAATLVCAGDTTLGATRVLAYGHASQVGSFLCTSEQSGMQCGNTSTGHGFTLSRDAYELF